MEIVERDKKKVMLIKFDEKQNFEQLKQFKQSGGIGIVHTSTGHDNISQVYCDTLNLKRKWLDGYSTQSVVEFGVLLLLKSSREQKVLSNNEFTRKFVYKTGSELNNKTVLIIGSLGRIGRGLAKILESFGMAILKYDSKPGYGFSDRDLFRDLAKADYVFLCVNGEGNKRFFKKKHFAACLKKPVLINLVRKSLISDPVLKEALNTKLISEYYVDDIMSSRFKGCFNVHDTGHVGARTVEARAKQKVRVNKLVEQMFE